MLKEEEKKIFLENTNRYTIKKNSYKKMFIAFTVVICLSFIGITKDYKTEPEISNITLLNK